MDPPASLQLPLTSTSSLSSDGTDEEYDSFHECGAGPRGTTDKKETHSPTPTVAKGRRGKSVRKFISSSSSTSALINLKQAGTEKSALVSASASRTKKRGQGARGTVFSLPTQSMGKTGKGSLELVYSASAPAGREGKREDEPTVSCESAPDNKRCIRRTVRGRASVGSGTTRQEETGRDEKRQEEAERGNLGLPSPSLFTRLKEIGDKPAVSSEPALRKVRGKGATVLSASASRRQEETIAERQEAYSASSCRRYEEIRDEPTLSSESTLTKTPRRGGRAKIPSALTFRRQEETTNDGLDESSLCRPTSVRREGTEVKHTLSSETKPTMKTGRRPRAKYSPTSACPGQEERSPIRQDEIDEDRLELTSSIFTSQTGEGDEDAKRHSSASTLKGRGARAKDIPGLTSIRHEKLHSLTLTQQEESDSEAEEYLSEPNPAARRTDRGARAKTFSAWTSARRQEESGERPEFSGASNITRPGAEEFEFVSGSASAAKRRVGTFSRSKVSAPKSSELKDAEQQRLETPFTPATTRQEEMGRDEHCLSSRPAPALKKRATGAESKLFSDSTSGREEEEEEIHAPQLSSAPTSTAANENKPLTPRRRPPNKEACELNELALIKEATEVGKAAGIEVSHNPTKEGNDFFEEEVKLENDEKHEAFKLFDQLRTKVMESLNSENSAWKWQNFNSGSSYDGTKVTRPDEIDIMFYPTNISGWVTPDFHDAPPGFCFLKVRVREGNDDPMYAELKGLCDSRMCIIPGEFKEKIFESFRRGIAESRRATEVEPASTTGTALRVKYYGIPSQSGTRPFYLDLVPALQFSRWPEELKHFHSKLPDAVRKGVQRVGFHVVPKSYRDGQYGENGDLLWRLSFSAAEKEITNYVDGKYRDPNSKDLTTCRKYVLRMVKRILEIAKDADNSRSRPPCASSKDLKKAVAALRLRENRNVEINFFCTYKIRTLLWDDFYVRLPADGDWKKTKWRTRLHDTLASLKQMMTGEKSVSHFFVPAINIMDDVPVQEREFLYIIFCIAEKIF